jgi:hypothetical protein
MPAITAVSTVVATTMVTDVGMSAAVAIVTSAATMETSAAVKSSSATVTMLCKSRLRRTAERNACYDYAKNS